VPLAICGHKTRAVFDRYNIVSPGDLAEAARRIDQRIAQASKPPAEQAIVGSQESGTLPATAALVS